MPSTGGSEEDQTPVAVSGRTASTTHDQLSYSSPIYDDHLVGLVVKASASRAGGPGFESR